jgi:hypothetical protein
LAGNRSAAAGRRNLFYLPLNLFIIRALPASVKPPRCMPPRCMRRHRMRGQVLPTLTYFSFPRRSIFLTQFLLSLSALIEVFMPYTYSSV